MNKITLLILLLLIISCSTPEETVKKRETDRFEKVEKFRNEVKLDIKQNVSWINKMPGSPAKFHVSGKLDLLDGDDYDVNELHLKYLKIYQGKTQIYDILPKVIKREENGVISFTYSTIEGLSLNDKLQSSNPILIELIFVENKKEFRYRINNVKVEEVF